MNPQIVVQRVPDNFASSQITQTGSKNSSLQQTQVHHQTMSFAPQAIGAGSINSSFNEQTLNKQGQLPMLAKQVMTGMAKVDPKQLSNEELEYIIKTGKLPPKYFQGTNQPQQQQIQVQQQLPILQEKLNMLNANQSMQSQAQNMNKTSSNHPQLQSFLYTGQQPTMNSINFQDLNKENLNQYTLPLELNEILNPSQSLLLQQYQLQQQQPSFIEKEQEMQLKHYSSPRMLTDYQSSMNNKTSTCNPFIQQQSQQQQQMMIQQTNNGNTQHFNLDASPIKIYENSVLTQAPNNQTNLSSNQQQQSQAASQALKALQEKVKALETEKQFLEDRVQIIESSAKDTQQRLQSKLKEETERSNTREAQLKEEVIILKKQLETVESEKMRHLEENSNERDQWRQLHKKVEEENIGLRKQLNEEMDKYKHIEDVIQDIKRREAQLRDRYEQEVQNQREKVNQLQGDIGDHQQQYEKFKLKLLEKNKLIQKEYDQLETDYVQLRETKERDIGKLQRELQKSKREVQILKEEMSILGVNSANLNPVSIKAQTQEIDLKKKKKQTETPKGQQQNPRLSSPKSYYGVQKNETIMTQSNTMEEKKALVKSNKKNKEYYAQKKSEKSGLTHSSNATSSVKRSQNSEAQLQKTQPLRTKSHERKDQSQSKFKNSSQKSESKGKSKSRLKKRRISKQASQEELGQSQRIKDKTLNGVQSVNNLISINTKKGHAETIQDSDSKDDYILINDSDTRRQKRQSSEAKILEQSQSKLINHYKRQSRDGSISKYMNQFSANDYCGGIISQQNSVGMLSDLASSRPPLELGDILNMNNSIIDRTDIDNEIFYLEREIFDFNQQYKTLLSQSNCSDSQILSISQSQQQQQQSDSTFYINQKLRQIAQMLEEKSEKLFQLKKQQQQILLKESYRDKNGGGQFIDTSRSHQSKNILF